MTSTLGPHLAADGTLVPAPMSRRVMNLADLLHGTARRLPDHPGLVWRGETWSWRAMAARVIAAATALAARGVAKGDRVLCQARNGNAMFEAMFAVWTLGAVWVPTNFRNTPQEVAYIARASRAKAMLCESVFPDHASAVKAEDADLVLTVSIGPAAFADCDWEALVAEGSALPPVRSAPVEYDDPCWFFFTSGTTGRPKAAVLTHGQMGFVVTNHLADLVPGTSEHDASLVVAPLSHGAGIHQLTQVARGARTVLLASERLDCEEAFRLIEEHRVTNLFTVPTILTMLASHEAAGRFDHSSLRHVIYAGSPMYRADQQAALKVLGKCIVQYFGLGEVTGNITVFPPREHDADDAVQGRIGTCGFPRTAMDVRILDEAGRELPPFETGEICVAGPAVFAGYFDNPEANAKSFRDGFFRTGDLGHRDEEGYVYITGRASDMYISGGSNVYPREIEEVILTHPAVAEVAVLGVPDRRWGEAGIAVLVARPGASVEEGDILRHLDGKLARYKMPRQVVVWEELPKSGYGKVPKKLIREMLIEKGTVSAEG
ncbi:acyl-CoA synthetase [Phreatobacter oligotrophus]|uniref:acyl-CoA synthetase n=1 Tax=Phreatobacter oligotrophus TaxID=1122261 RepID=UPI002353E2D5|nr:acyl-CoA synthetase [Phreatobacter oligotrophus]MBX9990209.1 acyl-CoA synthetase [Phreatobacter oligotrophus]